MTNAFHCRSKTGLNWSSSCGEVNNAKTGGTDIQVDVTPMKRFEASLSRWSSGFLPSAPLVNGKYTDGMPQVLPDRENT